jgi:hypothetical protein
MGTVEVSLVNEEVASESCSPIARVWGFIRLCGLSRDLLTVGNVRL